MRPGDIASFVPSPLGSGAALLAKGWLAALIVGVVLALLTAFIRDVHREGGFWKWIRNGIKTGKEVEEFRTQRVEQVAGRRLKKLEAQHRQREFKRSNSSRADQMDLFPGSRYLG